MTEQSENNSEIENQDPIDAIRRMNPGVHISSGAELAKMIKGKEGKGEEGKGTNNYLLPITEWRIKEYAHFENLLTREIFEQLSEDSLNNASHVIGVSGRMSWVAYDTAKRINYYRLKEMQKKDSQMERLPDGKACTVLCNKVRAHEFFLLSPVGSLKRRSKERFMYAIGKGKRIIFVHYLFDHPKYNSWKYTNKDLAQYEASESIRDVR